MPGYVNSPPVKSNLDVESKNIERNKHKSLYVDFIGEPKYKNAEGLVKVVKVVYHESLTEKDAKP